MINLYELLEAATGQLFGEPVATLFTEVCYDARHVGPGQLYAAVRTARGDGHQYIGEAIAAGATGVICQRPPDIDLKGVTCLVVKDVHDALVSWVAYVLRRYGTTPIVVTGGRNASVTREALALVLGAQYRVFKSRARYQGQAALPLAISGLEREHRFAVLEIESDHPGDMADIVSIVKPLVGVVTDVPQNPAGQVDEYRALIEGLPTDGLAVLNYNDARIRAMAGISPATAVTFGIDVAGLAYGADLMAYDVRVTRYRTSFDLRCGTQRYLGRWMHLLGAHQLYGVLAALQVGQAYGVPLEVGAQVLTDMMPLPGQLRSLEGVEGCQLIDDTLDATVESTLEVLDWIEAIRVSGGRVIFVMGDIAQSDTTRKQLRDLERRAAEVADILITQGRMAAQVGRAAVEHDMSREHVHITFSHADTITCAREALGPDDMLVVVGAAHARMERVLRGLLLHPADTELLVGRDPAVKSDAPAGVARARRSWVEIDLAAVANNVRRLKEMISPQVALMAVVRADAYGHGAVEVGATAIFNGAAYLGVASLDEGLALREAGVSAPILVLGYTPGRLARQAIAQDLSITLFDLDTAQAFNDVARALNTKVRAHYQIDTGLRRLGLPVEEVSQFFRVVVGLDGLQAEGLYTQLADADQVDQSRLQAQLATFKQVLDTLAASGIRFDYVHAADTAAALAVPASRFSMVRAGSGIYGLNPSPSGWVLLPEGFRPAMTWKTRVVQVKTLPPGTLVGPGDAYVTRGTETIAVIPVGSADGLRTSWVGGLARGQRAPLVGQIGMDHAALNVTAIPDVSVGDEVVLLGQQGEEAITVDEVARALGVANHAVVTGILAHTPDSRVIME